MSKLIEHAEREMKLLGLYSEDAHYGVMIQEAVMALVKAHCENRNRRYACGGPHSIVIKIFEKLINFETLTPISSNPDEWFKHGEQTDGPIPQTIVHPYYWQNIRQPSCFSKDGGKTWYDIYDPEKKNWPNRKWYQRYFLDLISR